MLTVTSFSSPVAYACINVVTNLDALFSEKSLLVSLKRSNRWYDGTFSLHNGLLVSKSLIYIEGT